MYLTPRNLILAAFLVPLFVIGVVIYLHWTTPDESELRASQEYIDQLDAADQKPATPRENSINGVEVLILVIAVTIMMTLIGLAHKLKNRIYPLYSQDRWAQDEGWRKNSQLTVGSKRRH